MVIAYGRAGSGRSGLEDGRGDRRRAPRLVVARMVEIEGIGTLERAAAELAHPRCSAVSFRSRVVGGRSWVAFTKYW